MGGFCTKSNEFQPLSHGRTTQPLELGKTQCEIFLRAAAEGDVVLTHKILSSEQNSANAVGLDLRKAMHLACAQGHTVIVELIINIGTNPTIKDKWGLEPLHEAILQDSYEVVDALRECRVKLSPHAMSSLELGLGVLASRGDLDEIKQLIRCRISVNAMNREHRTPLHMAASSGHLEIVQYLISCGADIHLKDCRGSTALTDAIREGHMPVQKALEFASVSRDLEVSVSPDRSEGACRIIEEVTGNIDRPDPANCNFSRIYAAAVIAANSVLTLGERASSCSEPGADAMAQVNYAIHNEQNRTGVRFSDWECEMLDRDVQSAVDGHQVSEYSTNCVAGNSAETALTQEQRAEAAMLESLPLDVSHATMVGQPLAGLCTQCVSVFSCDIVGFTTISAQLPTPRVSSLLRRVFARFDRLAAALGVQKVCVQVHFSSLDLGH